MTFQVRLYIHHDNDLIQLHLNGICLCDIFAKSLEAHYKKEKIQFDLPESLELKPHKGRVYRVKVTLDDKKKKDLVQWVCAFPNQYKCHCIKNIARSYLGSMVIDSLNGMSLNGTWEPDKSSLGSNVRTFRLKKRKRKTDTDENGFQWIEQVSASRKKTGSQIRRAEEGRKKIYDLPIEEILGAKTVDAVKTVETVAAKTVKTAAATKISTAAGLVSQVVPDEAIETGSQKAAAWESGATQEAPGMAGGYPETDGFDGSGNFYQADDMQATGTIEEEDDFDASLLFEQMRTQ